MSRLMSAGGRGRAGIPLLSLTLLATVVFGACDDQEDDAPGGGARNTGGRATTSGGINGAVGNGATAGDNGGSPGARPGDEPGGEGGIGAYLGPSVGSAKPFAILAYSAVAAANVSEVSGEIGVSAGALSTISGFDAPDDTKYGIDSLPPNDQRTILAQKDVTSLVGDIDPRACDADYTDVVGGLTGDVTLSPGVTCMNSFSADVLLNGIITLDAGDDPNAFFIIRGNRALEAAVGTQVALVNGAQACSVFWRFNSEVTLATGVEFYGNIISGTAITMVTGATLLGRALAQTAGVQLDANTVTLPADGLVGSAGVCTHRQ